MPRLIPCLALLLLVAAADPPTTYGLVVFKLGESHATDEHAGPTIDKLAEYLGAQIEGAQFKRRGVRNKAADALKLLKSDTEPVSVAILSAGFYFKHQKDLKLAAIAEARRGGHDGEQFVLVGSAEAKAYPQGARVATTLAGDADWLNKAVLPAPKDAKPMQWVHYDNLFDAAYAILDGEKDAPQYVLADRLTLKAMQADEDLKALTASLKSEVLPQDLVVEVDRRLGNARDKLAKALAELDKTEAGKKLGESLQTANFPAPDAARLARVAKLYE